MLKEEFREQVENLLSSVSVHANGDGPNLCEAVYNASTNILFWIEYLKKSELTGCCDGFLDGLRSSIVETAGCLSLGLVRPAIFSIRGQIDIILAWIYFKDHPVEWSNLQEKGENYMLKSGIVKYLEEFYIGYTTRFAALLSVKTRTEKDPYGVLSAHVHSQSQYVVPTYTSLDTLVMDVAACEECVAFQAEATEWINDVLLSCVGSKWASLPSEIVTAAQVRLGSKSSKVFF
ncbi:hypothetical protein ACN9MF_23500 [Methylobacterium fujisawaense]|uniref:hypothetical protein n=1 Tax=Methylobacterium fujisawaense TaxID=107400 RepID=UPI003CE9A7AC